MIQPLFDGMLAILLAKFVINDLPHAAGLLANPNRTLSGQAAWAPYWDELSRRVKQETGSDIDKKFSMGVTPAAEVRIRDEVSVPQVKELLAWYYLIAEYGPQHPAYDVAVSRAFTVASALWTKAGPVAKEYFAEEIRSEPWREPAPTIRQIDHLLQEALASSSRADKLVFVDTYMYHTHEAGMSITLNWPPGFLNPASNAVLEILGLLAGENKEGYRTSRLR